MYSKLALIYYVAKDDLEHLSPECWDCKHTVLYLVYTILGIEYRTCCRLGKHSTT